MTTDRTPGPRDYELKKPEFKICPLGRICIDGCPGSNSEFILLPPRLPGLPADVLDIVRVDWCAGRDHPTFPPGILVLFDPTITPAPGPAPDPAPTVPA